ncbi:hypothetical protein Droror1_Dr00025326 [Drosera rotundifolia]
MMIEEEVSCLDWALSVDVFKLLFTASFSHALLPRPCLFLPSQTAFTSLTSLLSLAEPLLLVPFPFPISRLFTMSSCRLNFLLLAAFTPSLVPSPNPLHVVLPDSRRFSANPLPQEEESLAMGCGGSTEWCGGGGWVSGGLEFVDFFKDG